MLVGKPPTPWSGADYIAQERDLQSQFDARQQTFDECVAMYNVLVTQTATRLSQISRDSLTNTWLSEIEHYASDMSATFVAAVEDPYKALVSTIDFIKGHMTQILDVIGFILAVAAVVVLIVGTDGAALSLVATLLPYIGMAVGEAQMLNSAVLYHEGKDSLGQALLGIGTGALDIVGGGLIGQAASEINGTVDATSTVSQVFSDVFTPAEVVVPDGATFASSFAFRLTYFYTPTLDFANLASSGMTALGDFVNPNFSAPYVPTTP